MTIEEAEKELIRVLDAKVAAGAKLTACGNGGKCALQVLTTSEDIGLDNTAKRLFGWTFSQAMAFMFSFDGNADGLYRRHPEYSALGDRIARRYGIR